MIASEEKDEIMKDKTEISTPKKQKNLSEKLVMIFITSTIVISLFALLYTVTALFFPEQSNNQVSTQTTTMQVPTMSRMGLTSFDKELARKFMDKNNDGRCDSCGMPVEQCIDSGQIQCNMDPETTIGVLQSQHIHTDWKIYINGKALSFEDKDHMGRMRNNFPVSSFIHVDSGASAPEKTGDIIHMHATGVPLWIFFESIDLKLPDGMKAYVNGKEISDYKDSVFNDLDKILITDGTGDLKEQLNSITNFAEVH